MAKKQRESTFSIIVGEIEGLQLRVVGDLSALSHGLAEAMKVPELKEMVLHAYVIWREESEGHTHICEDKPEEPSKKNKPAKKKLTN